MPQVLANVYNFGADQQIVRVINGGPTNFGNVVPVNPGTNTAGDGSFGGANTNKIPGQVVRLGNEFYASIRTTVGSNNFQRQHQIRVYNPATLNWELAGNGFTPGGSDGVIFGLNIGLTNGNIPRVFGVQGATAGTSGRIIYRDLGGAPGWIQTPSVPITGSFQVSSLPNHAVLYRNQLHWALAGRFNIADPANLSLSQQPVGTPGSSGGAIPMGTAQGRLFAVALNNYSNLTGQRENLYEFTGLWSQRINGASPTFSGPSLAPTLPLTQQSAPNSNFRYVQCTRSLLFEDPATRSLIYITFSNEAQNSTPRGVRCFIVDLNTFALTEITNTVVDAALRFPTGPNPNTSNVEIDMVLVYDTNTNPANPVAEFGIAVAGSNYTWYRWNGVASLWSNLGSGQLPAANVSEITSDGGGQYIYDGSTTLNPALYLHEVGRTPQPGAVDVELQAFAFDETGGSPATPNEDVQLFLARAFGPSPSSPTRDTCQLSQVGVVSGPGAVPTLGPSNTIQGVDFDNGATTIFARWAAIAQGLFPGENHTIMPRKTP